MRTLIVILVLLTAYQTCQAGSLKDEYELKKKCGEDAALYFSGEGKSKTDNSDVVVISYIYENHYNKRFNACIILTETIKRVGNIGIVVEKHIYNIYENELIAYFSYFRDKDYVAMCKINDRECKTEAEFNKLVRPYMVQ